MAATLIIAGRELSVISWLDFEQRWELVEGGRSATRMASGALHRQSLWERWRTTLSGSGWVPAPLLGIDYEVPFTLASAVPVALNVGDALPAGWSSRPSPWDERVVTDAAGNSVRLVYPVLTVVADPPRLSHGSRNTPGWELVCEMP